jgi:hypothetical protein
MRHPEILILKFVLAINVIQLFSGPGSRDFFVIVNVIFLQYLSRFLLVAFNVWLVEGIYV